MWNGGEKRAPTNISPGCGPARLPTHRTGQTILFGELNGLFSRKSWGKRAVRLVMSFHRDLQREPNNTSTYLFDELRGSETVTEGGETCPGEHPCPSATAARPPQEERGADARWSPVVARPLGAVGRVEQG